MIKQVTLEQVKGDCPECVLYRHTECGEMIVLFDLQECPEGHCWKIKEEEEDQ